MAYLTTVVEDRAKSLVLEGIPISLDFLDVLPKELPGMPLDREIEFVVDLISEIVPIPRCLIV